MVTANEHISFNSKLANSVSIKAKLISGISDSFNRGNLAFMMLNFFSKVSLVKKFSMNCSGAFEIILAKTREVDAVIGIKFKENSKNTVITVV